MVRATGIKPARGYPQRILVPLRFSPPGRLESGLCGSPGLTRLESSTNLVHRLVDRQTVFRCKEEARTPFGKERAVRPKSGGGKPRRLITERKGDFPKHRQNFLNLPISECYMVRAVGIEPTLCHQNRILSPARLPVPPRPQRGFV